MDEAEGALRQRTVALLLRNPLLFCGLGKAQGTRDHDYRKARRRVQGAEAVERRERDRHVDMDAELDGFSRILPLPYRVALIIVMGMPLDAPRPPPTEADPIAQAYGHGASTSTTSP